MSSKYGQDTAHVDTDKLGGLRRFREGVLACEVVRTRLAVPIYDISVTCKVKCDPCKSRQNMEEYTYI